MNVIFTCGGTAGHINPAIAVANTLRDRDPNCRILFIGAKGCMEEKLVPKAGFELRCVHVVGLRRSLSLKSIPGKLKNFRNICKAISTCKKIFREFRPDVIVGTGGYASFPALYAGSAMGIPTCVHESNVVPGLTTKMAARKATKVMVCFAESAQHYRHPEKVEVVGMPVQKAFYTKTKLLARQELGIGPEEKLVVSAFGSLGAKAMNEVTAKMFCLEKENGFPFRHIHATGSFGWEWVPGRLQELGLQIEKCPSIDLREYIYNMPTLMAAADVIIGRAGSSSCNEIGASGTPCILIPSPNVTNDHQLKNARIIETRGGAVLLPEPDCTPEALYEITVQLLEDPQRRSRMSKALRSMVVLDSAEQICDRICELAHA